STSRRGGCCAISNRSPATSWASGRAEHLQPKGTNPMKAILTSVLVAAFACVALAGCASFEQHENSAKVLVTYGTFKAIEHGEPEEHAERAAKIGDIALQARAVASGDGVILEALEAAIRAEVSELNLSAPDQYLAGVLVDMVVA